MTFKDLVVGKWIFEQECVDLNHKGKSLSKGDKLQWSFAKMSGARKE